MQSCNTIRCGFRSRKPDCDSSDRCRGGSFGCRQFTLQYDPPADFAPVSQIATAPIVVVAAPLDADSSLDHVFFPDGGVVSVMAVYAEGGTIEMATIGREGCTGVQAVFGAKNSSARFSVQIPGSAAKMPRSAFIRAMGSMPSFRALLGARRGTQSGVGTRGISRIASVARAPRRS